MTEMNKLDDVIQRAMDGEECEMEVVSIAPTVHSEAPEEAIICATHGCEWRDDEAIPCDEHRKITTAVRIGWDEAIDAATVTVCNDPTVTVWQGGNLSAALHRLRPEGD